MATKRAPPWKKPRPKNVNAKTLTPAQKTAAKKTRRRRGAALSQSRRQHVGGAVCVTPALCVETLAKLAIKTSAMAHTQMRARELHMIARADGLVVGEPMLAQREFFFPFEKSKLY